jgi:dGTPase
VNKKPKQKNPAYASLLSNKRERKSTLPSRTLTVEAESDRGRLLFSAPFRRLQQKAQVFSLEANAAVRSRLTHSIEVAQIGRFIADQIVETLLQRDDLDSEQARAFVTFVEVACLMHDLGNPPFGHFGEAAIADWFRSVGPTVLTNAAKRNGLHLKTMEKENVLADFVEFDGNCQGLRIAALLQWNGDPHGLNLTYTSMASYLKYLRAPLFNAPREVKALPFQKKAGFFSTEQQLVEKIWAHFGVNPKTPRRFPLAYVMEAADDIAYCISDLEDAIEKELLKSDQIFQDLRGEWQKKYPEPSEGTLENEITKIFDVAASPNTLSIARFTNFRTRLSRVLSEAASAEYCARHASILSGATDSLISASTAGGAVLEMLKEYCRSKVYRHHSIERKELAGLTAVRGLLDHFRCLLECSRERFEAALDQKTKDTTDAPILVERKLLSLFPERHVLAYRHSVGSLEAGLSNRAKELREWNLRAHLVTDFVSGMTDDFALWSFQMLSGIRTS